MTSINVLLIGDQHFQVGNIPDVEVFIEKIERLVNETKPDFIVCLGDLLHTHERLHTIPLNKAFEFIDKLRKFAPVYSLIGNHDMCNHTQFLSENHWQNSLKKWENVVVVDKVISVTIKEMKFVFTPYVFPGRFQEALNTLDGEWKDSVCIFAHQEFYGCKMGAIISEEGDKWPLDFPEVISGHIHLRQKPQANIYYTGSAMQHAFGESSVNTVALVNFTKEGVYTKREIDLGLPRKKIIYKNFETIKKFKLPDTTDKIKISLKGTYEEFKIFKKSQKYKKLVKQGVKIVYSYDSNENLTKEYETMQTLSFKEVLTKLVMEEKDNYMENLCNDILNK